ncbi:MAG: CapA family protein [Spirochaetaceae bacterium]|nr:CapA family protein [Spirochaetaceae bacterium]
MIVLVRGFWFIGFALTIIAGFSACLKQASPPESSAGAAPAPEPSPPAPAVPDTLVIVAAGDNLFHTPMIRPPQDDAPYNFTPFYAPVKHLVEAADIAFINQETLLAGKNFGFSGYPRFNTPQEAGDALIATGFTVINHANNHVMDKGEKAVFATMDFWDARPEITYLGIRRSQEKRNIPAIIEKNGVKVGFLAYTYGTNGLPVPKDKPYLVSLLDTAVMAAEIDALRPLCDFLVVSLHWGNEYQHTLSGQQKTVSAFLAEHNVDLIVGHHPHVLQSAASLPRKDGKTALCFYSLGNFISAQDTNATLLGGLLFLKLKKTSANLAVTQAGVIPVVTHYEQGFTNFRVYPLYDYSEKLAEKHRNKSRSNLNLPYLNTLAEDILGTYLINYNPFACNPFAENLLPLEKNLEDSVPLADSASSEKKEKN